MRRAKSCEAQPRPANYSTQNLGFPCIVTRWYQGYVTRCIRHQHALFFEQFREAVLSRDSSLNHAVRAPDRMRLSYSIMPRYFHPTTKGRLVGHHVKSTARLLPLLHGRFQFLLSSWLCARASHPSRRKVELHSVVRGHSRMVVHMQPICG